MRPLCLVDKLPGESNTVWMRRSQHSSRFGPLLRAHAQACAATVTTTSTTTTTKTTTRTRTG